MSKISPSPGSGTASPAVDDANGYLLLTIPHTTVKQVYDEDSMVLARGEFRLECISIPIPAEIGKQTANPFSPSPSDPIDPTHDFWLVIRVGPTFEMSIIPSQNLTPSVSDEGLSYTIPSTTIPNGRLILTLPKPSSAAEMEDLDSFEVLLRQYGSLGAEATALSGIVVPNLGSAPAPLAEELRGRLVLVNEDNGEVVGELEQSLSVEEDKKVATESTDRPVVLDFGSTVQDYAGRVVVVKTVPEDEMNDWMLKGAHNISKGILSFSSWSQKLINSGATAVVNHTTPMAEPVKFHPAAKASIRTLHNTTVKTMNVTKSTMNVVNNAISTVVEKTYEKSLGPTVDYTKTNVYDPLRRSSMDYTEKHITPIIKETVRRGSAALEKPPLPFRRPVSSTPVSDSPFVDSPGGSPNRSGAGTPQPNSNQNQNQTTVVGEKIPLGPKGETLVAGIESQAPPVYSEKDGSGSVPIQSSSSPARKSTATPPTPTSAQKKRPFFSRVLLAGEVVLTSLEATANDLITTGTAAASTAAGHKFGPDAGHATALLGGSVRNVAVVYVDIRGVGRRALLQSTAKGFVKTRLRSGESVTLQAGEDGTQKVEVGTVERVDGAQGGATPGQGELVVGMKEVTVDEKKNQ